MTLLSEYLSGYISGGQYAADSLDAEQASSSRSTYMMKISRGVILRSAGLPELWRKALKLFTSGVAVLLMGANRFRRRTRDSHAAALCCPAIAQIDFDLANVLLVDQLPPLELTLK